MKMYLYEGLNKQDSHSMMLWESAGRKLVEAALTADQITQLFQQIEQGATAGGGNRTLVGKGVDAGSAVKKAYDDLVSKVQNSGPMKNADALYDQAAAKLKQATGGDQGVMQYVQKYRDFAKKHPVAQSLIYGALIAAAGISGAGVGGAAALGLLKMTDKLLQGEKFSTALGQGLKTGALAYGASKLGDLIKNTLNPSTNSGRITWENSGEGITRADFKNGKLVGDILYHNQMLKPGDPGYDEAYKAIMAYAKDNGMTGAAAANVKDIANTSMDAFKSGGSMVPSTAMKSARELAQAKMAQMAQNATFESRTYTTEQVTALFEHIVIAQKLSIQLQEGIWDDIKSGTGKTLGQVAGVAGKAAGATTQQVSKGIKAGAGAVGSALGKGVQAVAQKAKTIGHNIATKTTADKLQSAWKAAGSPTDSEAIIDLLTAQGIDKSVITGAMKAVAPFASVDRSRLPDVSKLNLQQKQQLLKQLDAIEQGQQPTSAPALTVPGTSAKSAPGAPVTQPTSAPKVVGVPTDARPIAVPGGGATGLTVPGVSNTTATPAAPTTTTGGGSPARIPKPKVPYSAVQPKGTGTSAMKKQA